MEIIYCQQCGSENASDAKFCYSCGKPITSTGSSDFPDFIEYKANFNEKISSIGGKLIITPTQLIFKPSKINIGNLNERVFEIKDIVEYKKGLLTFLYISFLSGETIKLTVWNKGEIIDQLEQRRNALK